jgi:hypothetical protein
MKKQSEILLSPKFNQFPAGNFSSCIESIASVVTAISLSSQFWQEGMVKLPSEHPSLILNLVDDLHSSLRPGR